MRSTFPSASYPACGDDRMYDLHHGLLGFITSERDAKERRVTAGGADWRINAVAKRRRTVTAFRNLCGERLSSEYPVD